MRGLFELKSQNSYLQENVELVVCIFLNLTLASYFVSLMHLRSRAYTPLFFNLYI